MMRTRVRNSLRRMLRTLLGARSARGRSPELEERERVHAAKLAALQAQVTDQATELETSAARGLARATKEALEEQFHQLDSRTLTSPSSERYCSPGLSVFGRKARGRLGGRAGGLAEADRLRSSSRLRGLRTPRKPRRVSWSNRRHWLLRRRMMRFARDSA